MGNQPTLLKFVNYFESLLKFDNLTKLTGFQRLPIGVQNLFGLRYSPFPIFLIFIKFLIWRKQFIIVVFVEFKLETIFNSELRNTSNDELIFEHINKLNSNQILELDNYIKDRVNTLKDGVEKI